MVWRRGLGLRQTAGMRWNRTTLALVISGLLVVPFLGWAALIALGLLEPSEAGRAPFQLSDRLSTIAVESDETGALTLRFGTGDSIDRMSPEAFARALAERQQGRNGDAWWLRALDITGWKGLLGIAFGVVAQGVFMSRMLVQWIASEKVKRSVVPVAFWWLSLIGATMLIAYFVWRREPVGLLGQAFGWFVYVRNLWLIYNPKQSSEAV